METTTNIKKVALIFFIVTGLIHLSTSILINNKIFLKESLIANKIMDIPFIITGIIYGFASLRLTFYSPEKDHKILDIVFYIITAIVLIALIVINLFVPNLK